MRTDPSLACMRAIASPLGVDGSLNDTDLQIAVWKALYERLSDHVDQLHAAFARLMTEDEPGPHGALQEAADIALFMDQFLADQPFDLIAQLQAQPITAQPPYEIVRSEGAAE